jgi:hypothetical protein
MRVPPPLAGDRVVGTQGGETQRDALLLCLLFLTPPRKRKLVKSPNPSVQISSLSCIRQAIEEASICLLQFLGAILTKLYSHPRSVAPLPTLHTCAETRAFGVATAACENPEESRGGYPKPLFWWKIAWNSFNKIKSTTPLNLTV